ncbi:MAG TPA: hypothetical protein VMM92_12700, partial [Thermoanaerobaculia bacterium]|nr:hypothetical protein [Thermoanaerobaculia bacterium]
EATIDGASIGQWDNKGGGDHAEVRIVNHLRAKYKPESLRGKLVSIVINRAPCEPCAKTLEKFKQDYGVHMRVKATRITREGKAGLPILSRAGIHFRLFTREQRDSIHGDSGSNRRVWNIKSSQAVTEADRYDEVSEGRDTKTVDAQDAAEATEAAIAEKYFPNARKSWRAQGLNRSTLVGPSPGGSGGPAPSSSKTHSRGARYSPYGK